MARKMPVKMQIKMISAELVDAGYEPEMSDIRAIVDSSLTYPENRDLVARAFGYRAGRTRSRRIDHGALDARAAEYAREQKKLRDAAKRKAAPKKKKPAGTLKCGVKGRKRWQSDRWLIDLYPDKIARDRRRKAAAKPPGCRISKSGNRYYERRTNRSDMPGRKV